MALRFFTKPSEHANAFLGDLYVSVRYVRQIELGIARQEEGFEEMVETAWEQSEIEVAGGVYEVVNIPFSHVDGITASDYNLKSLFTVYFPNTTRCGSLVSLWSEFEVWLTTVACELADYLGIDTPKLDKKSTKKKQELNIKIAFDFMRKQGVNVSGDTHNAFKEIEKIREIRHCIAHNNGRLDDTRTSQTQRLKRYISESDHIELECGEGIILRPSFLTHYLDLQDKFAKGLAEGLGKFEEKKGPPKPDAGAQT